MRELASLNGQVAAGVSFDQRRLEFLSRFDRPVQAASEFQAGIPQALTLMNGQLIGEATDLSQSRFLQALVASFLSDDERVEALFLATLSRPPAERERHKFVGYVTVGPQSEERMRALSDCLWALLNSAEFMLNH